MAREPRGVAPPLPPPPWTLPSGSTSAGPPTPRLVGEPLGVRPSPVLPRAMLPIRAISPGSMLSIRPTPPAAPAPSCAAAPALGCRLPQEREREILLSFESFLRPKEELRVSAMGLTASTAPPSTELPRERARLRSKLEEARTWLCARAASRLASELRRHWSCSSSPLGKGTPRGAKPVAEEAAATAASATEASAEGASTAGAAGAAVAASGAVDGCGGAGCAGGGGRTGTVDGGVVVRYTATRSIRASAKGDCQ